MKIATYNVNSIRPRMPILLKWLKEHQPDVLCLQETKVTDDLFPLEAIKNAGYECAYKGEKSYNGVAILSRVGISETELGFDDGGPEDKSRLIKTKTGPIYVVNTYVPNGRLPGTEQFEYKLMWFKRLKVYFADHFKPTDPVVWLGDLNIAPEDIDVYNPSILRGNVCFHPDVQAALKNVMGWGFVDLLRMHNKEPGQYTYWDYRYPKWTKKDIGWRLDHIMATKPLAKKCTNCYIDRSARMEPSPSDHTFVMAEFKISF